MLLNVLARPAQAAFERQSLADFFDRFWRRKFHWPEMGIGIDKCDAINIAAWLTANIPDEANLGLLR